MSWYGSGFIVLLNYASATDTPINTKSLITDSTNLDILTEDSQNLLTES